MQPLYRRLTDAHLRAALAGSAASLLTKLAAAAASVALTVLIARQFGATGSGTWALATTLLTIAGYVSLCGLDYSTTRAIAVYRAAGDWSAARAWTLAAISIVVIVGGAVTAIMAAASPWISKLLNEAPLFAATMQILSWAVIPCALLRFTAGALRGVRRFALADILESGFLPAALSLGIIALSLSELETVARYYIVIALAGSIVGLALWLSFLRAHPAKTARPAPMAALSRSLPLAGAVLATLASPWIVTLFLATYASTIEVGVFRVALQFSVLLGFLLSAVETGLSPQIASLHSQHKLRELSNSAKKMTALLLVAGGGPALVLIAFAPNFLSIMGHEFVQGTTAMRILIAAQVFNLATGPVGSFMVMTGLERLSLWNAIASGVLVLVLSLLLIPTLGTEGAAIASASAMVFRNLSATLIVWRRHGLFLPLGLIRPAQRRD